MTSEALGRLAYLQNGPHPENRIACTRESNRLLSTWHVAAHLLDINDNSCQKSSRVSNCRKHLFTGTAYRPAIKSLPQEKLILCQLSTVVRLFEERGSGEIGRRTGFRFQRSKGRVGSSPTFRTKNKKTRCLRVFSFN